MRHLRACDTHRLILVILGVLGTLSLISYVVVKVVFNKEPSELLLSGGFCAVITGLLGNMGRGATTPSQSNSGTTINEAPTKEQE